MKIIFQQYTFRNKLHLLFICISIAFFTQMLQSASWHLLIVGMNIGKIIALIRTAVTYWVFHTRHCARIFMIIVLKSQNNTGHRYYEPQFTGPRITCPESQLTSGSKYLNLTFGLWYCQCITKDYIVNKVMYSIILR
jgi:hypothetical protein